MNVKIKTLTVKLSDAEIGRNAKLEHVRDLRDAGHPALHFRFSKNRTRGSWYLVNKRRWHRIGAFPALSAKQVLAELPSSSVTSPKPRSGSNRRACVVCSCRTCWANWGRPLRTLRLTPCWP